MCGPAARRRCPRRWEKRPRRRGGPGAWRPHQHPRPSPPKGGRGHLHRLPERPVRAGALHRADRARAGPEAPPGAAVPPPLGGRAVWVAGGFCVCCCVVVGLWLYCALPRPLLLGFTAELMGGIQRGRGSPREGRGRWGCLLAPGSLFRIRHYPPRALNLPQTTAPPPRPQTPRERCAVSPSVNSVPMSGSAAVNSNARGA